MKLIIRICSPLVVIIVLGVFYLFIAPTDPQAASTVRPPIVGCAGFGDVTAPYNQIDAADRDYVLNTLLGVNPWSGAYAMRADVNDDGAITPADATLIDQYINVPQIITTFAVCNGKKLDAPQCTPSGDVYDIFPDLNKVSAFDVLYVLEDEAGLRSLSGAQREQGDVRQHGSPD